MKTIGCGLSRQYVVKGAGGGAAGALVALGRGVGLRPVAAQEQAVLDAWAAASSSGSAEQVAAVFADDGSYEDVPSATIVQGSAEIAAWAADYFALVTNVTQSIATWAAIPTGVVVQWRVGATRANYNIVAFRGASLLDLAEGKVAREIAYYDNATFITRAGGICQAPIPAGTPAATPEAKSARFIDRARRR